MHNTHYFMVLLFLVTSLSVAPPSSTVLTEWILRIMENFFLMLQPGEKHFNNTM